MKYVLLAALLIVPLSSEASAQGRPCTDPPTGERGKCSKQAGAMCDPTSHRWIGGNKQAYFDCIKGKGLDSVLTCTSQQDNCRDNVLARGLGAKVVTTACFGLAECLRTGTYRYIGRGGVEQRTENLVKR